MKPNQNMSPLESLWTRGCTFLNTKYAIMGGAMTWISERNLVSAISNAGGFGIIACGAMDAATLETEIAETQDLTEYPFGVNLITIHPDIATLINVCARRRVSHVALAGGVPARSVIDTLNDHGIRVICFAPTLKIAHKLVEWGAGALVIEGSEAGGHIGPVSTSVLAQEILPHIRQVPVFVAGGIGRGDAIASYLQMGASGVQLGTRFACACESIAHDQFKMAFIRANARDAVASLQLDPRFPVAPVRALSNAASLAFLETQRRVIAQFQAGEISQKEGQIEIEYFWSGALRRAVIDGDVETGSVMAGQSVSMVTGVEPVTTILDTLMTQANKYLARGHQAKPDLASDPVSYP